MARRYQNHIPHGLCGHGEFLNLQYLHRSSYSIFTAHGFSAKCESRGWACWSLLRCTCQSVGTFAMALFRGWMANTSFCQWGFQTSAMVVRTAAKVALCGCLLLNWLHTVVNGSQNDELVEWNSFDRQEGSVDLCYDQYLEPCHENSGDKQCKDPIRHWHATDTVHCVNPTLPLFNTTSHNMF